MRIAMFCGGFPKFSETFIQRQAQAAIAMGHDVTIFPTSVGEGQLEPDLRDRVRYPNPWVSKVAPFKAVADEFKRQGSFDLLHFHFGHVAADNHRIWSNSDLPLVVTFHGYDANVAPKNAPTMYDALRERATVVTTNTQFLAGRVEALGFSKDQLRIVPVGISDKWLAPVSHRNSELSFVSVGRLVEAKGFEYAIDALKQVDAEWRYTIIGGGALRDDLESMADDRVTFRGALPNDDVLLELDRHNVFLMPSVRSKRGDEETQGVVLQEAQARGLVYVASNIGGISDGGGAGGYFVDPLDRDQFVGAIEAMIERRNEWPEMGTTNRAFVEARYTPSVLKQRWDSIYRGLRSNE